MDDIKQQIQAKVQEMRRLNQEFREKYPELNNNYWFNTILDKIKSDCFANQLCEDFIPSDNDLNQIDQAASFLNIDYDLYCDYQRAFPCKALSFCVVFDFSKSYNQQKTSQERCSIMEINKQLNPIWAAISDFCLLASIIIFFAGAVFLFINAMSITNSMLFFALIAFALIAFPIGIIGTLINNHQIKKVYKSIPQSLRGAKY